MAFGVYTNIAAAGSVVVFIVSTITGNVSQVDRLWSMIPTFYTLLFCGHALLTNAFNARLAMMAFVQVAWSIRLTRNYWLRGGYQRGHEDYRWAIVRTWMPHPAVWVVFNALFISIFQNWLLLWIATPGYLALVNASVSVGALDYALFAGALGCLAVETISDHQQNVFHKYKVGTRTRNAPAYAQPIDVKRGFVTKGMFTYCRHPNYAAEQTLWWIMYAFGAVASGAPFNWTIYGIVALCILFRSSTKLTEDISCSKYKAYAEYQKQKNMFLPTLF